MNKVFPYKKDFNPDESKTEEVRTMFDNISNYYDVLNDIMSLGFGRLWRRKAINTLLKNGFLPKKSLDVAAGTGDFSIKLYDRLNSRCDITGIDLAENMLQIAIKKSKDRKISFMQANGEEIPFDDNQFDSVSCSYGIRNFNNPQKGLNEFYRVLKNGGRVVILELSEPKNKLFRILFEVYFKYFVPVLGGLISKDLAAYKYLPKSVHVFPSRDAFVQMLITAGFENCKYYNLFGGIATLYYAEKSE